MVNGGEPAELSGEDLDALASIYVQRSKASATRKAYETDWKHFATWCATWKHETLPATPRTVALYLTAHGNVLRPATLERRLVSISLVHKARDIDSPTRAREVRDILSGIKRAWAEEGVAQEVKAPVMVEDLRKMIAALPVDTMAGKRDRALLLLGWAAALRRSELATLTLADVSVTGQGLIVTIRRSKTDQEGAGRRIGVPNGQAPETCPVRAVRTWIEAAKLKRGPLFRRVTRTGKVSGTTAISDRTVALIVKKAAAAAGLDPALYAGHSMRAGLATSAAVAGATYTEIKKQTGHKSDRVLERYIRDGELFRTNAAAKTGL